MARKLRQAGEPNDSGRFLERNRKRLDLAQIWKLRVVNRLSLAEIARTLGVAKSTVHAALQRIQTLIPDPEVTRAYEEVRPTLLTAVEQRLMASLLDEDTLEKASLNNRAYAFQQVFNARRLETGQSTQNHSLLGKLMSAAFHQVCSPKQTNDGANETSGQ